MKHRWINPCAVSREQTGHTMCDGQACMWCDGGLEYCKVCGSFEGATTTHCPGAQMDRFTIDKVYTTDLDFVNGSWQHNRGKDGVFRSVRGQDALNFRAAFRLWQELPSMEREKVSRGWATV